jgi:hypothetical protein
VDQLRLILPEDLVPAPEEIENSDETAKVDEPVEDVQNAESNESDEHHHIEESA